jgi:predicted DNA-binding ribbon-helix-helix protein
MAKRARKRSLTIKKHSMAINGHKTSLSLEDEFWSGLQGIADDRNETVSQIVARIDADREYFNLASAVRVFVLRYYRYGKS